MGRDEKGKREEKWAGMRKERERKSGTGIRKE